MQRLYSASIHHSMKYMDAIISQSIDALTLLGPAFLASTEKGFSIMMNRKFTKLLVQISVLPCTLTCVPQVITVKGIKYLVLHVSHLKCPGGQSINQ